LEQNYRSSQRILDAANSVIDHNFGRKPKKLWTDHGPGEKIICATLANEHEEAFYIAREIETIVAQRGLGYGSFAVLYRTNAQSRVIEDVLVKSGLPYTVVGGTRFYQRKEIKDILSYLRVIANPSEDVSLYRIINTPRRGIGDATINNVKGVSEELGICGYDVIKSIASTHLSSAVKKRLSGFGEMMEDLMSASTALSVPALISYIMEKTGYLEQLQAEDTIEAQGRIDNLRELVGAAMEFENRNQGAGLEDFLAEVSLVSDVDQLQEGEQALVLMTLHGAKGLEFPVVFLAGMDEGIFPHTRTFFSEEDMEEERRLCYVGITRAKERLYLTGAECRSLYGNTAYYSPSRFIDEIPKEILKEVHGKTSAFSAGNTLGRDNDAKAFTHKFNDDFCGDSPATVGLKPGDRISHSKWGEGVVTDVSGMDENAEVSIDFPGVGRKHLALRYAPIKKL